MKIGLLGYGYTASFFAQLLVREGHEVWGTRRDTASLKHEIPPGVDLVKFNFNSISACLIDTSCLLISTPPNESGVDPSFNLLDDLIVANKEKIQWIAYLSSTGVYGDHQGGWVDETSLCYPKTIRAKNRLSVEKAWLSLCHAKDLPVIIFRLSGIYGPRRNALDRLRAGKNITAYKEGHFFSRIHVDDICQALFQSMLSPMPGEIFNLSDDFPCGSYEVDCFAANLLKIKIPRLMPYQEASISCVAKEFYESNRRVSNAKLKKIWLPHLRYPTYQEGLKSILLGENL